MIDELKLTEKQKTIVHAIEQLMKEASYNDIHFVCDQYRHLYAYNGSSVSCFDAPCDAAYERKEAIQIDELDSVRCRVDYTPVGEDIYVGLYA